MGRYKVTGEIKCKAIWYVDAACEENAYDVVENGEIAADDLEDIPDSITTYDCEYVDDGSEEDHHPSRRDR